MGTRTAAVYTDYHENSAAGTHLGSQINETLGAPPNAVIVFASARFEHEELLRALSHECRQPVLIGASSAGEFIRDRFGEGTACALAIRSDQMAFAAGLARDVSEDRRRAAEAITHSFRGLSNDNHAYKTAVIMTDALAGHADELVEELTLATSGAYQFAGGGAGDDARFARTHVFCGTTAHTDAVVALEILSQQPVGIGVGHGWSPASQGFRVTEVEGSRLISLNGMPAVDAFEDHAAATRQTFDRSAPLPFFLHNIIGIETGTDHRLRVPLAVNPDGSVSCAAEIPEGSTVFLMKTTSNSAIAAAAQATASALRGLHGRPPGAALFFDCVATRLRMGTEFDFELESVAKGLSGAPLVGCNTYGQIARAEGQFGGFHNCTAVVLALPA